MLPKLCAFSGRGYTEGVNAQPVQLSGNEYGSVPVCIGFDYGHEPAAGGQPVAQDGYIVPQMVHIQLDPSPSGARAPFF